MIKTFFHPLFSLMAVLLLSPALGFSADSDRPWNQERGLEAGMQVDEVIELLGEPKGYLGSETRKVYYFERGEVVFRDGRLTSHSIITEEEAERQRAEREAERRQREEREAERIREGEEVLERRLSDSEFMQQPARTRLAFFETFQRRYPEIDVGFHLEVAREEVEAEREKMMAEMQHEQRLAELEARAAEAETYTTARPVRKYYRRPVFGYGGFPAVIHHRPKKMERETRFGRPARRDVVERQVERRYFPARERAEERRHEQRAIRQERRETRPTERSDPRATRSFDTRAERRGTSRERHGFRTDR